MKIVVVGSGVVGTATGKGFLKHGHAVTFIDVNGARVDELRRQGLSASGEIKLSGGPTTVFMTVPTPYPDDRYDMSAVEAASRSIGEALPGADSPPIVVLRSTVLPGTLEGLVEPILADASGLTKGEHYTTASNPEFLRAECALEDVLNPWMTVVASRSKRTRERLMALYAPFGGSMRSFPKPAAAELLKEAHNLYNATKISFWNEMWLVADELDIDIDPIADTVALSAEGSWNPAYGIRGGQPYGGMCLPKDTGGFQAFARDLDIHMPVLDATIEVNDMMVKRTADDGVIDLVTDAAASESTQVEESTDA